MIKHYNKKEPRIDECSVDTMLQDDSDFLLQDDSAIEKFILDIQEGRINKEKSVEKMKDIINQRSDIDLKTLITDIKKGRRDLGEKEARFLIDFYYSRQKNRIRTGNQIDSIKDTNEPNGILNLFFKRELYTESDLTKILNAYVKKDPVGRWLISIKGIGGILAAALLALLNVEDKPTAGHFWSYAGFDPTRRHIGNVECDKILKDILGDKKKIDDDDLRKISESTGWRYEYLETNSKNEKGNISRKDLKKAIVMRPHNATLKKICFLVGTSFIYQKNRDNELYGKIYTQRLAYETGKNDNLEYKEQAYEKMHIVKKTTEAYKHYSIGKLPPAHLTARARRYTVKMFLSHLHHVMYLSKYGEVPPKPFAIEHLGHSHLVLPPNLDILENSTGYKPKIAEILDVVMDYFGGMMDGVRARRQKRADEEEGILIAQEFIDEE